MRLLKLNLVDCTKGVRGNGASGDRPRSVLWMVCSAQQRQRITQRPSSRQARLSFPWVASCAALVWLLCVALPCGCDRSNASVPSGFPPEIQAKIKRWVSVEDFPTHLALFKTVFWEPEDTHSLRKRIRQKDLVTGKSVLEIGTGSGLISLCCLEAGARRVVATDVNSEALANARFNAQQLGLEKNFQLRLVPLDRPQAYSVIGPDERFDLIISNPPWEDGHPERIDDYAFYDPGFELLDSLLEGLEEHLSPGGKALLAYGCVSAIRTVLELAPKYHLQVEVLDERNVDELPEVFLPGMLLQVTVKRDDNK